MAETINIFSKQFRDDFLAMQAEIKEFTAMKQPLYHRLGMMIPMPPIPGKPGEGGTQTVHAGRILGHTGASPDFAYDAISNDGSIVLIAETPQYRPNYPLDTLPAADGSGCIIILYKASAEDVPVAKLYSCPERSDNAECAAQPPALQASFGKEASAAQEAGYSAQEEADMKWS